MSLDDRLLEESREYARKHGTTLNGLIRDLLAKTVGQEPGAAFASMVAEAKTMGVRSVDGPLSRDEAHERA